MSRELLYAITHILAASAAGGSIVLVGAYVLRWAVAAGGLA